MSRKTERMRLRCQARMGEPLAGGPSLRSDSAAERSKAILALGSPEYWAEETKEAFEAACRRPLDLSIRERVAAGSGVGRCDAFVKALCCAGPQAAEALWRRSGSRFQGDQARQFMDMGGLEAQRPQDWAPGLRKAVFEGLCEALPEGELWAELRRACGWPESADGERRRPARWVLGAGLRAAGVAQRQDASAEAAGALAEMARAAIARFGDGMEPGELRAWAGLAKASAPSGAGQRAGAQSALMEAAGRPVKQAQAVCGALKEAGLFGEIDARYLAALGQRSRASGWIEALWREPERPGEGLHPAWLQWMAPQGAKESEEGFEALLSLGEWPGARAPAWRALRSGVELGQMNAKAGVARWLRELGGLQELGKAWFLADEARAGGSLPAELAERKSAELFEPLARLLAQKGLAFERWPGSRGGAEERGMEELTESWGEGRALWERACAEAALGASPARAPKARL